MPFSTAVEKLNGEVVAADLACSVREENTSQKESYSADWNSICLKTRPQEGQTQDMKDDSRKETLYRQWQLRTLGQACPSGVFRLGTVEHGGREHQLLPKRNTLPLPIFTPSELGVRLGRGWAAEEEGRRPFSPVTSPAKRTVDEITRDLPPVKPLRMEFASKALGRSMSVEAQRG
ncbi:telethonin [Gadus macrocephalus]|uniref:telethonin n=1 Tax=Gadus macrocephalus TaxID=80720 RepID=UPI0028CB2ED6|nr:telethonin [Gadus macrocephalus]